MNSETPAPTELGILRLIQQYSPPFGISSDMLRQALLAQFEVRAQESAFIPRPNRITTKPPFVEDVFSFPFELSVLCMLQGWVVTRKEFVYYFKKDEK